MQRSTTGAPAAGPPVWDWPAAGLVILLVQVAAARLVMTAWTPFLYYTQTLAGLGCALGFALAQSRFTRSQIRWLAIAYTAVILPWQLLGAVEVDGLLLDRLAVLGTRLWVSLGDFFARKPVEDALLFVAVATLGFWLMSLIAGYSFARRREILPVVVPAAAIMLLVHAYDDFVAVRIWAIAVYVFLALLLLGRLYLLNNRVLWDKDRVFVTAEARRDVMRSLITISTISVVAAWSLPISLEELESTAQSWNRFTRPFRDRFSNAVTALESPNEGATGGDFYGPSLSLTLKAPEGDVTVFTVTVDEEGQNSPPRYYWRGHVYNHYSNGKWSTTSARATQTLPDSSDLPLPSTQVERDEVTFDLALRVADQTLFYAPAEPVWISRPGAVYSINTPDGQDLSAWEADPGLNNGDRYQVRALIANPTIDSLRLAGAEYPEWITSRYLEVPDPLLPQLRALAEEVTAGQLTPYDKAQAITSYLREEIEYETALTAPPQGLDPVLWMLFESKKGFCTHYASAEVLLLRSLGIPARMAVGFAEGQATENSFGDVVIQTTYVVRKMDAHAWPEVYFPGAGWVEFEPTGNQDPLSRPATAAPSSAIEDAFDPGSDPSLEGATPNLLNQAVRDASGLAAAAPAWRALAARALWVAALAAVAAGAFYLDRRYHWLTQLPDYLIESYGRTAGPAPRWLHRWARWNALSSIERSFQAVNLSLRWLGKPQPAHMTPIARAAALRKLLPVADSEISVLLNEHQQSLYTLRPGDAARARAAALSLLGKTARVRARAILAIFTGTPHHSDTPS